MKDDGIGVSYDVEYRGVSITVPFRAQFINPAVPQYTDTVRAAVGIVGTMVHELAHHRIRNHNAEFPAEMQDIIIQLDAHKEFDFHDFKQRVVTILANYADVFNFVNSTFVGGAFPISARGSRFKESGQYEGRDGGAPGDVGAVGGGTGGGAGVPPTTPSGAANPSGESRNSGLSVQIAESAPDDDGKARNQTALNRDGPGITATPIQPTTQAIRDNIAPLFAGRGGTPPVVATAAAHADRMNWIYQWMAGLDQLVRANPLFVPLLRYAERIREMHNEEASIQDGALRIAKRWRSLGNTQSEALTAFLDDLANMVYRTPDEIRRGVVRHPTTPEVRALATTHRLSDEAAAVGADIKKSFTGFLELVRRNAIAEAIRLVNDPISLANKLDEINAKVDGLKMKPYFPFMRFGRHFVMVKDAAGNTIHFETFESLGVNPFQRAEARQQRAYHALRGSSPAGSVVEFGVLPEQAEPFIGLPSTLLEAIKTNLVLNTLQRDALEQLSLDMSPAMSFKHRFQHKSYTPGYSMDFRRSFARYFFNGARYYSRTKYAWELRDLVKQAHQVRNSNKANQIGNYMDDHLNNTVLDSKGDFGLLKAGIFLFALGYVPAAATMNLIQTPLITFPFLAGKFGDARASKHLVWAMGQVSNFYKRGKYDTLPAWEMKALGYGISTGRVSETQAPELAGMSQGANLLLGIGGNSVQRGWTHFMEKSAIMFELAEQFNRRVAYRATLRLAMERPNAKVVREAIAQNQLEYDALLAKGTFSPAQTAAVITANSIVDQTQYVYARYARPRFMRGRWLGALFVFKKYLQSTLWMLAQNKSDVLPRYLVMAMFLGGLGGVPGWDDLTSLVKAIAHYLFGKQFNLEHEVRKFVKDISDGTIDADLVLHGLARRGFGVPALLDLMGSFATGTPGRGLDPAKSGQNVPYPVLDRSRAISLGLILPIDVGKAVTPTKDVNSTIADQTQRASGAAFSVGFNMYKAIMDNQHAKSDPKRWERAVPRVLGSASRAFRAYTEERERGSKGGPNSAATVINFDPRDTEQMMEILAMGMGYQPLRLQAKWDDTLAKAEVTAFYDLTKAGLLQQLFEAKKGRDPKEIASVMDSIRTFNRTLPDYAKGKAITPDTADKSMQSRQRAVQGREIGVPVRKEDRGISRYIDSIFPESTVDVRRVR